MMNLEQIVQRITAINRAWKVALGDGTPYINTELAKRLQKQKSAWQIELYRTYPNLVWFKLDVDGFPDGSVYSVRFCEQTVTTADGDEKWNAEHIPKHLLSELLTKPEFQHATQRKHKL
ncbi:hypothetical protein [uncultured Ferrimonas sp.]|uniref:hypothetical protein n=1 Tax=uncultured Ferrimonas sp. TaxID=432640 RepID=UPI00262FEB22|nr:hypothetical protein [uncultured Ferrimonas sp.]